MRKLFWGIITVSLAWSAYWYIGANTVQGKAVAWLEDRRAEGWAADAADITTRGFPSRFDTTLVDLRLADPETGVGWAAPFFQVFMLSYRPNEIIAVWPPEHTLILPDGNVTLQADDMRASARFRPNTALELENAVVDLKGLQITDPDGGISSLDQGMLAVRRVEIIENTYDIFFDATALQPGGAIKQIIDPNGRLPDVFEVARFDLQAGFDRPWTRAAVEQARPQPTALQIKDIHAKWGALDLRLAGDMVISPAGRPTGQITVKLTNWQDLVTLLVETGVIPANFARTLDGLLGSLARASGPPNTLDVPVTLSGGDMRVGFIPLGPAPVLKIR
ncbi:MAG: DUF2125 domain-containing protein [Pseudomonadota bacterium]